MKHLVLAVVASGVLGMSAAANAQEANAVEGNTSGSWGSADSGWTYQLQLYIWGTEVGGTALGSDFSVGFDDLAKNLNGALMGGFKAFNNDWMTYGELGFADIGNDTTLKLNPGPGPGVEVDGGVDVQSTVVSFGGGYRLVDSPDYTMYGTAGVRYLRLDLQLELEANERLKKVDSGVDYWDAVIGLEGEARFNQNWFLPWKVDVGAGQSDFTWQAAIGVGYRFNRNDVVFGYRHMEWDLPSGDSLSNYYQSGPVLLWNIRF